MRAHKLTDTLLRWVSLLRDCIVNDISCDEREECWEKTKGAVSRWHDVTQLQLLDHHVSYADILPAR